MSDASNEPLLPVCAACGRPHLPTRWDREYLCPTCGKPLQGRAGHAGRRFGIPMGAVAGIGLVLLLGGGMRLAADHLSRQPQASPVPVARPVVETLPQITLPPEFETRLIQKIDLLREDLRAEPSNAGLLQRLAETHLLHAMYYREMGKSDLGQGSLQRARRVISRLEAVDPQTAQDLGYQFNNFDRLEWGEPRSLGPLGDRGSRVASAAIGSWSGNVPQATGQGSAFAAEPRSDRAPLRGFHPPQAPPPFPEGLPFRSAPGGGGSGLVPFPRGTGSAPDRGVGIGFRSAPVPAHPQDAPGAGIIRGARGSDPEKARLMGLIPFRTELMKSAPTAVGPALDLGNLYESLAAAERRLASTPAGSLGEAEQAWLRKAVDVYASAAGRSPVRAHRATLYDYAADQYGRLREWELQYQLLRKALEAVPTSPRLWRKFQSVCLLTGRREENLEAREQYKNWSFPTLVFRDL